MYYEEKLIDGVLWCRGSRIGEWLPVPIGQLSQRIVALELQRRNFANAIADRIAALEYERNNAKKQAERLAVNGQIGLVRAIWHDFEYEN